MCREQACSLAYDPVVKQWTKNAFVYYEEQEVEKAKMPSFNNVSVSAIPTLATSGKTISSSFASNGHSTDSPSSVAVVKSNESPVTSGKKEQKERFSNEIDEQGAAALIQSLKSAAPVPPPPVPSSPPPKPSTTPPAPVKRDNSSDNSKPSIQQEKKKIETSKDDDSSSGASDSEEKEAPKKSEALKKQTVPPSAPPVPASVSNPAFNPSVAAKQEENLFVESTNPIHSSSTPSNDDDGDQTSRNSLGSPAGRRSRGGRGSARHKPPPPPNGTNSGDSAAPEGKKDKEGSEDDNTVSNPITAGIVAENGLKKKNSEESTEDYPVTRNDDVGSFENSTKPTGAVRRRSANMKRVASSRAHLARTSITGESPLLPPAVEPDKSKSEPAIKETTSGNSGREEPIQQSAKKELENTKTTSSENSLRMKTTSVDSAEDSLHSTPDLRSSSSSPKSSLKKPGSEKERDISRTSLRVSFKEDLSSVVSNTDEDDEDFQNPPPRTKQMQSLELEEVRLSSRQPTVDPHGGEKKRGCLDSCILQ
jgi:hypothetical protein